MVLSMVCSFVRAVEPGPPKAGRRATAFGDQPSMPAVITSILFVMPPTPREPANGLERRVALVLVGDHPGQRQPAVSDADVDALVGRDRAEMSACSAAPRDLVVRPAIPRIDPQLVLDRTDFRYRLRGLDRRPELRDAVDGAAQRHGARSHGDRDLGRVGEIRVALERDPDLVDHGVVDGHERVHLAGPQALGSRPCRRRRAWP